MVRRVAGPEHRFEFIHCCHGSAQAHREVTLFGCPPTSLASPLFLSCRHCQKRPTVAGAISGADFDQRTGLTFVHAANHQSYPIKGSGILSIWRPAKAFASYSSISVTIRST